MTVEASFKEFFNKQIEKLEQWDQKLFLSFYNSRFSARTKKFARYYSFFGNYFFWGALWLVMGIYAFFFTKDYYLFILFTGAFDQGFAIYLVIRYKIVNRNRPFITLNEHGVQQHDELIAESKSFPSGHVTFFLYFGTVFAFYYQSWLILSIFIVLDIIMAVTRLILGVHFPVDVIFGFVFGLVFAFLYLGITYPYWVAFYYWLGDLWQMIKAFFLGLLN